MYMGIEASPEMESEQAGQQFEQKRAPALSGLPLSGSERTFGLYIAIASYEALSWGPWELGQLGWESYQHVMMAKLPLALEDSAPAALPLTIFIATKPTMNHEVRDTYQFYDNPNFANGP